MSDHMITWTHIGDSVHGHIACTAPADAPCRRETVWVTDGSVSSYVDTDHCVPAVLLNEHDCFEAQQFYAGPVDSHTSLHDGPVDVRWNGHDWEWEYTDQPTPSSDPVVSERMACAGRIQAFIDRHQGSVSDGYVRGLRAALLVVKHVDLQGQSLPSSPAATGATP